MLRFDPEKVRKNVEQARTEDLLDRITVYLDGMEPEAVEIIERELARRGVMPAEVENHAARHRAAGLIRDPDGLVRVCQRCSRPAVEVRWGWQRLFGLIPIFPRPLALCALHRERQGEGGGEGAPTDKAPAAFPAPANDHFEARS
jgi:hypothetical protein